MQYLKADTNVEVLIGPAVAVGDGFTPVTNLSLSTADEAEIIKHNGATALVVTSISGNTMAAITSADGYYTLDLSTGNLDTEGPLTILINDDSLILPIRQDYMVVSANVYDSLFAASGTDNLDVALAAGAITNASLAGNMEIVFETDFATNYNQTDNAWVTNGTSFVGTGWNTGKTGYSLTATTGLGNQTANITGNLSGSVGSVTAGVTLANGAVTDASLAGNMEIVFETDFATNYNQTDNGWVTNGTSFIGTGWNTGKTGYTLTATTGLGDQTADITGNLSGSVGSVTGAVGSVTGAVGSVTGHTNQTGDTYALANGAGGFSDINTDVEAIKVITDALTSAGAANLALSAAGIIGGATSGTPTTVASDTDLTGYADDELIGRTIIFTGGTADGQASDITDYASTNGVVTYTAITTAPAASDTFVIV